MDQMTAAQIERLIDCLGAVGDETDDNDREIMGLLEAAHAVAQAREFA